MVVLTPKLPLLPLWEKGVGGMRAKMHGNAANRASLPKTLPLRACVTPGANSVPTLNAPQPVLYYFPPDDIASRVSVDRLLNVLTVGLVKVEFVRADGD